MDSNNIYDYDSFLLASQNKARASILNNSSIDATNTNSFKHFLESCLHHYLNKKIPQTKIKFYYVNKESLRIEEEDQYVAEHAVQSNQTISIP